jgi:predicted GH43/DUF377 family glycosyl hydrolase
MRRAAALPVLLLSACGRYAEFTLPDAGAAKPVRSLRFVPEPEPVLTRGDWDSHDVLNPSVVVRAGVFYNFYSGYDGATWHTGLATSAGGIRWEKRGRVLSPDPATWEGAYIAANGSALLAGRTFLYWYHSGPRDQPRIGLARSQDGMRWVKEPAAVLDPGPRGSWDERGVADPYVIQAGDLFYLYYLGQDRARRQRLGVARSRDGVRWKKLRSNPILELGDAGAFDENGLGEPAVWQSNGSYWMLYTGRAKNEQRRIGLAQSSDGVRWRKLPHVWSGQQPWNHQVLCDPTVLVDGNAVRVWFGGGDKPSPGENLHGQIGAAALVYDF